MVNKRSFLIAAAALAGLGISIFLFFQSDEAKIKKRFSAMADKIEKQADESDLMAAAAAHQIEKMFGPSVRIEIPTYSVDKTFPNNEISANVLYAQSQYTEMDIEFHDFRFQFPEANTAIVGVTAMFQAVTVSGEPVDEIHEVECVLEKIDDEWLFTGIRGIDVLEK